MLNVLRFGVMAAVGLATLLHSKDLRSDEHEPFSSSEAISREASFSRGWRLLAVGDIMSVAPVVRTAEANKDRPDTGPGGYGWAMRNVAPQIRAADLAMGNLEFPVVPHLPVQANKKPFNGSPRFLDALRDAGFDLLFLANNHMIDFGVEGSLTTLSEIKSRNFYTLGVSPVGEERSAFQIVDVGDSTPLRVSFMNYTNGISDLSPIYNIEYLLFGRNINYALFDKEDRWTKEAFRQAARFAFPWAIIPTRERFLDEIAANVAFARGEGAEYHIAFLHWGAWGEPYPWAHQVELAQEMCARGVDVVIGAGPHVIQPVELLQTATDGSCLVAYSLGNFISGTHTKGKPVFGLMLELDIERAVNGVRLATYHENVIRVISKAGTDDDIAVIHSDRSTYLSLAGPSPINNQ